MAAVIDLTGFEFTSEELTGIRQLVYEQVVTSPDIALIHSITTGITHKKDVGFVGEGGLVGKAGQGCDPVAQAWNIATRKIQWEPEPWEIYLKQCYKDLEASIAIYSLDKLKDRADFTSSDYMAIVIDMLAISIKKMIYRIVWFNDKAAKTITNGGTLTDGTDIEYFTILNGLFKQIAIIYTAHAEQKVAITENAGASYVAQALDPDNIKGYLTSLVFGANMKLRQMTGNFILCTQSVHDAYVQSLQGLNIESMYINLIEGVKVITFNGIPLIPIPYWDEVIATYYNNGTKLANPHRAIFTNKEVLGVSLDDSGSFSSTDVWYDKKDRNVYLRSEGLIDAKIKNDDLIQIAI